MTTLVRAAGLSKRYGDVTALDNASFEIEQGRIVGLIGPNGAGKTTALKAVLGLTPFDGELEVLGRDPRRERHRVMQDVCFIADVAVMPKWLRVRQALDVVDRLHPKFDRARAETFLSRTTVRMDSKIGQLSKGMVTQLHLALVMAIEARLLVLDEPTLGLDILFRKEFYTALLNDYFDDNRTILVTTHQVEEIEHILTDVMFIDRGRLVLNESMEAIADRYVEVSVRPDSAEAARKLGPLSESELFGRRVFLFENGDRDRLRMLGEIRTPGVADLFVAKIKEHAA
ncbi:MAG: multidrug ABC transporter ATP-binding protein [Gammaproteobacteria bacterium SG8_31]|nr:MAG: multidrug ABC transporter ATP-binding protein [Gammaproteobacteria bacterium SG8_31]